MLSPILPYIFSNINKLFRMMTSDDLRAEAILTWLTQGLGLTVLDLAAASSDASFRRYLRARLAEQVWIIMDAPPERENIQPFIHVNRLLAGLGVNVPRLFHVTKNWVLLP